MDGREYEPVAVEEEEDDERLASVDDKDESGLQLASAAAQPMGAVDWMLLATAVSMLVLAVLIARQVFVAIFVALLCVGASAYAFVSAQSSTGPSRWLSIAACVLSIAAFLYWSFNYVFYVPAHRATAGCGGVVFGDMGGGAAPKPRDEL